MAASIHIDDLDPKQRKELGIKKQRHSDFTAEEVRSHALRILAELSNITRLQRNRVLKHAIKINKV